MSKKKSLIGIVAIVLLLAVLGNTVFALTASRQEAEEQKGVTAAAVVSELTGENNVVIADNAAYEDIFEQDLVAVEADEYVYLLSEDKLDIVAVLRLEENAVAEDEETVSLEEATAIAQALTEQYSPEFFVGYDYEVIANSYGEEEGLDGVYSIEFWQKIDENVYTDQKVALILDMYGALQSYVCYGTAQQDGQAKSSTAAETELLTESQAIAKAYDALADTIAALETEETESGAPAEKTGTDIVDSVEPAEDYDILLEDTAGHSVSAYCQVGDECTKWIVTIENVETNRSWTMGFQVILDGSTGDVLSIDYTR